MRVEHPPACSIFGWNELVESSPPGGTGRPRRLTVGRPRHGALPARLPDRPRAGCGLVEVSVTATGPGAAARSPARGRGLRRRGEEGLQLGGGPRPGSSGPVDGGVERRRRVPNTRHRSSGARRRTPPARARHLHDDRPRLPARPCAPALPYARRIADPTGQPGRGHQRPSSRTGLHEPRAAPPAPARCRAGSATSVAVPYRGIRASGQIAGVGLEVSRSSGTALARGRSLTTLIGGTCTRSVSMKTPPLERAGVHHEGLLTRQPCARNERTVQPRSPCRVGEQLTALVAATYQVLLVDVERLAPMPIGQVEHRQGVGAAAASPPRTSKGSTPLVVKAGTTHTGRRSPAGRELEASADAARNARAALTTTRWFRVSRSH